MRTWVVASLFVVNIHWIESKANPQLLANYRQSFGNFEKPRQQPQYGFVLIRKPRLESFAKSNDHSSELDNAYATYDKFEENFNRNLDDSKHSQNEDAQDRYGGTVQDRISARYNKYDTDYKTSQTTHSTGPHQVETIESEHYHKKVPAFQVSEFQQRAGEKHGEIHYHQHKHIHKHEHKQEHVHQHKQDHQHKHMHNQQHKHDHHSEHKHGHQHKHDHHQDHKHDHHHDHKHDNQHKHGHQHGHKHEHHSENKHQHGHKHKHGHKHQYSKY